MVKALIPISVNLESSIALRYAQHLSRWIDLRIHDIHVIDSDRAGPMPAAQGWVRNKWEKALTESAEKEISQFLAMESLDLKRTRSTEVVRGDRTEKLLEKLISGAYQLFIEGALPTFDPSGFYSLLSSTLYRSLPCPALVVKNPVILDKTVILMDPEDEQTPVSAYLKIFAGSGIETDIAVYTITDGDELVVRDDGDQPAWTDQVAKTITAQSVAVGKTRRIEGPGARIAGHLRGYGLVAASVPRNPMRQKPKLEILARLPNPVLICWSETST